METWKEIQNYEGLYQVSNEGRIRSNRGIKIQGDYNGYKKVRLSKNSRQLTKQVHRLVAQAFISNPDNKPFVNHKDLNRSNNHVNNLEWVTHQENVDHAIKNGHIGGPSGRKVIKCDLNGNPLKSYDKIIDVEKDGFRTSGVGFVCRGERKTHKGFIWKYL
jgi:hypothetical protein